MSLQITESGGDVFQDLGFDVKESAELRLRSSLIKAVRRRIAERAAQGDSQTEIADLLGVTQPRVSDLVRGKIHLFSVEMLAKMLGRLGAEIAVSVISRGSGEASHTASSQFLQGSFQLSSTMTCVTVSLDMDIVGTSWVKTLAPAEAAADLVIWSTVPMQDLEPFGVFVRSNTTKPVAASTQLALAA